MRPRSSSPSAARTTARSGRPTVEDGEAQAEARRGRGGGGAGAGAGLRGDLGRGRGGVVLWYSSRQSAVSGAAALRPVRFGSSCWRRFGLNPTSTPLAPLRAQQAPPAGAMSGLDMSLDDLINRDKKPSAGGKARTGGGRARSTPYSRAGAGAKACNNCGACAHWQPPPWSSHCDRTPLHRRPRPPRGPVPGAGPVPRVRLDGARRRRVPAPR